MMSDYISREAAIKEARNLYPSIDHYCTSVKAVTLRDLNAIPAADVVEVVRCKDCVYAMADDSGYNTFWCSVMFPMPLNERDHFCSDGKRRTE